jgi:hypothetical protein
MMCAKIPSNRTSPSSAMDSQIDFCCYDALEGSTVRSGQAGNHGSDTYPGKAIFLCVPSQYGFLCDSPHRQSNVEVELAVRPSEPRIINGPSQLFGPFAIGRIVNDPVPTTSDSNLEGSWAGSLNPDLTCAPSQKGLSRE